MYLGIDFSLRNTGFYISSSNIADKNAYHESGVLHTTQEYSPEFYNWYIKQFTHLLKSRDFKKIVIEDYAFSKNTCYATFTKEFIGILKLLLYKLGYADKTVLVSPQTVKKFITGNGHADKGLVLKSLYKYHQLDINNDNIGDAAGLCEIAYALDNFEYRELLTKEKQKTINKYLASDLAQWFVYVQPKSKKK